MNNNLFLIGRLVSDPEIKQINDEKCVVNISLAVQREFKNSDGIYDVDFIKCTLWNSVASNLNEYCKKGDLVAVRGRLQTNNYEDEDGNKKYTLDVIIDKVTYLNSAKH